MGMAKEVQDLRDETVASLKSLLASRSSVSYNLLQYHFSKHANTKMIPYGSLGFTSLLDFIESLPDVVRLSKDEKGEWICSAALPGAKGKSCTSRNLFKTPIPQSSELSFDEWSHKRKHEVMSKIASPKNDQANEKRNSCDAAQQLLSSPGCSDEANPVVSSIITSRITRILEKHRSGLDATFLDETYRTEYKQSLPSYILRNILNGNLKDVVSVHRVYLGNSVKTILYPKIRNKSESTKVFSPHQSIDVKMNRSPKRILSSVSSLQNDTEHAQNRLNQLIIKSVFSDHSYSNENKPEGIMDQSNGPRRSLEKHNCSNDSELEYFDSVEDQCSVGNKNIAPTSDQPNQSSIGNSNLPQCEDEEGKENEEVHGCAYDENCSLQQKSSLPKEGYLDAKVVLYRIQRILELAKEPYGMSLKFLDNHYQSLYDEHIPTTVVNGIVKGLHKNCVATRRVIQNNNVKILVYPANF